MIDNMGSDEPFIMWAVYDHPSDFPNVFIARRWDVYADRVEATTSVMTEPVLVHLRERLVTEAYCMQKLARTPWDDPTIIEVWLAEPRVVH